MLGCLEWNWGESRGESWGRLEKSLKPCAHIRLSTVAYLGPLDDVALWAASFVCQAELKKILNTLLAIYHKQYSPVSQFLCLGCITDMALRTTRAWLFVFSFCRLSLNDVTLWQCVPNVTFVSWFIIYFLSTTKPKVLENIICRSFICNGFFEKNETIIRLWLHMLITQAEELLRNEEMITSFYWESHVFANEMELMLSDARSCWSTSRSSSVLHLLPSGAWWMWGHRYIHPQN